MIGMMNKEVTVSHKQPGVHISRAYAVFVQASLRCIVRVQKRNVGVSMPIGLQAEKMSPADHAVTVETFINVSRSATRLKVF